MQAGDGYRMERSRFPCGRHPALMSGRYIRTNEKVSLLKVLRVTTGIMAAVLSSCVPVDGAELFRCEREEDLDGSSCRVDMLPDAGLAEMIYERGFDPEGATRMELMDAAMQLLDYEYATGENLREMEFLPGDDAYAADYEQELAAEQLLKEQEAVELSPKPESEATTTTANIDVADISDNSSVTVDGEGDVGGTMVLGSDEVGDENGGEVVDDFGGETGVQEGRIVEGLGSADTVIGYAQELGIEVLKTMKRDLNAVVGLLPDPVAKPIREVASVACDTAVRVVHPALKQAERYTRGFRREAMKSAGRLATRVKKDFGPKALRSIATGFSKAKEGLSKAIQGTRQGKDGQGESNGGSEPEEDA